METFIDTISESVVSCRSLTILSSGYLLPQTILKSVYRDVEKYVQANKEYPSIFIVNAPPHVYSHFQSNCLGVDKSVSVISKEKKRHRSGSLSELKSQKSSEHLIPFDDKVRPTSSTNSSSPKSPPQDKLKFPLMQIDFRISSESRKELYKNGGIYFITSRILISDLISEDFTWTNTFLYLVDIEDVIRRFHLSFVTHVYASLLTDRNRVRAFTQKAHILSFIETSLEQIKQRLLIEKVFFYPYSRDEAVTARINFTHFVVYSIKVELTLHMQIIERALYETMKVISTEIRARLNLTESALPDEKLLFGEFERRVKYYNRGSRYDEEISSMCLDLKSLRTVMFSMYLFNPVLFYIQVEIMRLMLWGEESFFWLEKKSMSLVFTHAKERMWNGETFQVEKQKKVEELKEIIQQENEHGNDVVVVVRNEQTQEELIHSMELSEEVLRGVYQEWFDRKNELEKQLKEEKLRNRTDLNSKVKKWNLVKAGVGQIKPENEKFEEKNEKEKDEIIREEDSITWGYQEVMTEMTQRMYNTQKSMAEATQKKMVEIIEIQDEIEKNEKQQNENEKIENNERADGINGFKRAENFVKNSVITQNELNHVLRWEKPRALVLYNCSLWVTRVVETYALRQEEDVRCYMLTYSGSYESLKYQQSIRREKKAFEDLIKKEVEHKNDKPVEVVANVKNRTKAIIVDIREFRCELPFQLFKSGFKLIPKQIEIGDYILSPNIVVERKSAIDLVGSLKSKRVNKQIQNMSRKYETIVLLIECYNSENFDEYDVSKTEQTIRMYIPQITELTTEFPRVKIVWTYSPQMTANIFDTLKKNEREPTEEDCKFIDEENEQINWNALEVVKRLPGIPIDKVYDLQNTPNLSISRMMAMNETQLSEILGDKEKASQFLAGCNFEFK
ncbi:DNA repair endonuclease xp-f / mei-9 / rad1, putative [Entamoeba invadens IP1]|uniref:DNA repair endonuclease xp-f / mei-9 / rad1, putative n=1 Tax=Entamoeba invadens IP1 TaxID=370355 RepID=A0A0A1UGT5_ENTIV|nr:DNA repair endonuclease xp-f / mei-9 / rad1, putative [Entamoeba invadens IP1]ELP93670.1 DNA repair endonuclease xp-f / mei-9 / rad1, putative [Entamoeba invadens IP1]|eukprot:XP_004260441.1 DNA repair endonuclease xp-f / mei-9 / rad1, putative [Entamoeba invadens IP1]